MGATKGLVSWFWNLLLIIITTSSHFSFYAFIPSVLAQQDINTTYWSNIKNPLGELSVEPIGNDSWSSHSRLACVRECEARFPRSCVSVKYERKTKLCVPGYGLIHTDVASEIDFNNNINHSVSIFSKSHHVCFKSRGFLFIAKYSLIACVFFNEYEMDYMDATEECTALQGSLYTIKSLDRWNILKENVVGWHTWVGLEDVYENRTFYWVDGERFLEGTVLWNTTWEPGDPNNYAGNEYCVKMEEGVLDDRPCDFDYMHYACETPM